MHVDVRDLGTNRGNEPFEITRCDALGNDGTGDYVAACITPVTFPNCGQRGASPVEEFISNRPGLVIDVRLEMPSGRRGGEGEIRTHEGLAPLPVFKSDRSR